jgi:hypothetical protein
MLSLREKEERAKYLLAMQWRLFCAAYFPNPKKTIFKMHANTAQARRKSCHGSIRVEEKRGESSGIAEEPGQ